MRTRLDPELRWWQTHWFFAAMAFVAAVPLIWPTIPPLIDLPGHMGRYRVQESIDTVPWLAHWYSFHWQLIGSLGVDLLIVPLSGIFGLELAVKLIVIAIPVLSATGLMWIAREVHGKLPLTAMFALPVVYSAPLHLGFVNFALSMALALNAFALWLRLARLGRLRLRAALFVPISVIIWITHAFGWGALGALAFSSELMRHYDRSEGGFPGLVPDVVRAGVHCLVLALPAILMLLWRSDGNVNSLTTDWFDMGWKADWLAMMLRDRWQWFDLAYAFGFALLLCAALFTRVIRFSRDLSIAALFLLAIYLMMPRIVFGSDYADMRLAPFLVGIAIIAVRPRPAMSNRHGAILAGIGLAFLLVRMAGTTASFYLYDRSYTRELAALDHVPIGARLLSFVGASCKDPWKTNRFEHLPGLALERRLAYSNDQWSLAGGQLLSARYRAARGFSHDASQMVTRVKCKGKLWRTIDASLTHFPRPAFDYVWLIDPPRYDPHLLRAMTPIWRDGTSVLLRIDHRRDDAPAQPSTASNT